MSSVRFHAVSREQVLGALKATGSSDPDVLLAAKEEFAAGYRPLKWFGIWALVTGALATALVLLAPIGIPLLVLGLFWVRRAARNRRVIDAAFAEHVATVQARAAAFAAPTLGVAGLLLLAFVAAAPAAAQSNDAVPAEWRGEWGAGGTCTAPLRLVLAERQATLVNGKDRASHGGIAHAHSFFGHAYQGMMTVLLPDNDGAQPYMVTLNAGEKPGQLTVEVTDAALKKRFPFDPKTVLRKCGGKVGGATAAPAAARSASACGGAARCVEVTPFAATITDFRVSGTGGDKILSYTVRFLNKGSEPLILGFLTPSALGLDDQGVRFQLYGSNGLRGIGAISGNAFDPKFTLAPGEAGDARVELVSRVPAGTIFGTTYDVEFAVREIEPLPGRQYQLGREHLLQFKGLAPAATGAPAAAAPAPAAVPASAPASPDAPDGDACGGAPQCYGAGPFAVRLAQAQTTKSGGYQTLRLQLRVKNVANEPLVLGFKSGSQTASDDTGDRLRSKDEGVKGIGLVTGSAADPQFTLAPGQERAFTLDYYKGLYKGTVLGTSWNADFVLQALEILPSRQVRTVRDYAIGFADVAARSASSAAANTAGGSEVEALVDGVGKLFGKKKP
jgi:hypothetical protein